MIPYATQRLLQVLAVVAGMPAAGQDLSADCVAVLSQRSMILVAPAAPGGGYDTYARAFAPALESVTGARVSVANVPAGGGRLAMVQVGGQEGTEILILLENLQDLVALSEAEDLGVAASDFAILGVMVSEPTVWMGRPELDLGDTVLASVVIGGTSVDTAAVDVAMVADALGLAIRVVPGYDGSSELVAGILREEIDVIVPSLGTALRNAASSGLEILVLLDDTPHALAPGVPVLAGPQGLVVSRAAGLDPAERTRRAEIAELVVALTGSDRSFLTTASLEPAILACLREATDLAILSPAFVDAAAAQGRPVEATLSTEAVALFGAVRTSHHAAMDMMQALMEGIDR